MGFAFEQLRYKERVSTHYVCHLLPSYRDLLNSFINLLIAGNGAASRILVSMVEHVTLPVDR